MKNIGNQNGNVATDLTGATEVTEEITGYYMEWLKQSRLQESEFLKIPKVDEFQIVKQENGSEVCYQMGNKSKNTFVPIGEPLGIADNENAEQQMTLVLFLFYIVARLEESHSHHEDYFYKTVKSFVHVNFKNI